jgi:hypothetical protein
LPVLRQTYLDRPATLGLNQKTYFAKQLMSYPWREPAMPVES